MLWYGYSLLSLNPLYCLYVVSNTLYKDHGVFLFFLFFFFLYVMSNTLYQDHGEFLFLFLFFFFYLVSSKPATRVRATDALRTVLVITMTLTLPAYHMHKRTATERMVRFSPVQWFFQFSWCWSAIMLWYGYCLLSLNPLYCNIY